MGKGKKWSDEDKEKLYKAYESQLSIGDLELLFPDRTRQSIRKEAGVLGLTVKFRKHPEIDYEHRKPWTNEEVEIIRKAYINDNMPIEKIIGLLDGRSYSSIQHAISRYHIADNFIKPNNPKFKAVYQDYDWCFERYINRGMTHQQMADEASCTKRVIQKWCADIHKINNHTFRSLKHLNDLQRQIILFGTLGDGHIDNRPTQPMYIECHCESEKDYLFWKYEILKDLCNQSPVYYPTEKRKFTTNGKEYLCEPYYRLNTKILDDLYEIRDMSRINKIRQINDLGFCLHILDDGSRANVWEVCLAEWTQSEMNEYEKICRDKLGLFCHQLKDKRYYLFDAVSSKKIDEMILENLPNDLDIIHKKILDNPKIKELSHYRYVITESGKIGLSSYCRSTKRLSNYELIRDRFDQIATDEIQEADLLEAIKDIA